MVKYLCTCNAKALGVSFMFYLEHSELRKVRNGGTEII